MPEQNTHPWHRIDSALAEIWSDLTSQESRELLNALEAGDVWTVRDIIDIADRRMPDGLSQISRTALLHYAETRAPEENPQPFTVYSLGYSELRPIKRAAQKHGAGEDELAAIRRLEEFRARDFDVIRLAPLAELAGYPRKQWFHLFKLDDPEENPRDLNPGYRVPNTTVRLGSVLDLDVQRHQYRYEIGEFKGWHMLAAENGAETRQGYARLFLVPGRLENSPETEPSETGARTFQTWHRRQPEKVGELETPEAIGYYQGRVIRIGYKSDKWNRPDVEYDHSFLESGTPPKLYTSAPRIEDSKAAIITGGNFTITGRGIE